MHTDEYEISIGREIKHCEQVVKKITKALQQYQQRYKLDYAEAAQAASEGKQNISTKELAAWREELEALPRWEQRLKEYREALAMMRVSASGL